jgi:hypothetical protein
VPQCPRKDIIDAKESNSKKVIFYLNAFYSKKHQRIAHCFKVVSREGPIPFLKHKNSFLRQKISSNKNGCPTPPDGSVHLRAVCVLPEKYS